MLSHDLAAFAAQFRAWSRTGGITIHRAGCDELAFALEDLAGQARALERQPARPTAAPPALCGGVFDDLLRGQARRRHAGGTVVLLRRVPAIPPIPDGDDAA